MDLIVVCQGKHVQRVRRWVDECVVCPAPIVDAFDRDEYEALEAQPTIRRE